MIHDYSEHTAPAMYRRCITLQSEPRSRRGASFDSLSCGPKGVGGFDETAWSFLSLLPHRRPYQSTRLQLVPQPALLGMSSTPSLHTAGELSSSALDLAASTGPVRTQEKTLTATTYYTDAQSFQSQLALVNEAIATRTAALSSLPTTSTPELISHALKTIPGELPEEGLGLEGVFERLS